MTTILPPNFQPPGRGGNSGPNYPGYPRRPFLWRLLMFFLRPVLKLIALSLLPTVVLAGIGWWMLTNVLDLKQLPLNLPENVDVAEWIDRTKQATQDFFKQIANPPQESNSNEATAASESVENLNIAETPPVLLNATQK